MFWYGSALTSKCYETGACERKLLRSGFVEAFTLWFKVVNLDWFKLAQV